MLNKIVVINNVCKYKMSTYKYCHSRQVVAATIPTKYHGFFTTYHCKDSRDLHEQLKIGFIIIPGNEAEPCHGYSLFEAVCVMYCDMSCLS